MTASRREPDEPVGTMGDHSSAESTAEATKNPEAKAPATNDRAITWTKVKVPPELRAAMPAASNEALRESQAKDDTPARARAVPPPPPPHALRPRPSAPTKEDENEESLVARNIEHFDLDDVLLHVSSIPPPPPDARVEIPEAPRAYGALTAPPPATREPVPVTRLLAYGALAGAVFVGGQMAIGAGLHSLARPSVANLASAAKPAALALTAARVRTHESARHEASATVLRDEMRGARSTSVETASPTGDRSSLTRLPADEAPLVSLAAESYVEGASETDLTTPEDALLPYSVDEAIETRPVEGPAAEALPRQASSEPARAEDAVVSTGPAPRGAEDLASSEHAERIRRIRHRRILAIRAAKAAAAASAGSTSAMSRAHARSPSR